MLLHTELPGFVTGKLALISGDNAKTGEGGVAGLARGIGRGLVGAASRPAAGVRGLAAKTTEGLKIKLAANRPGPPKADRGGATEQREGDEEPQPQP